jgi:hypothetical protein
MVGNVCGVAPPQRQRRTTARKLVSITTGFWMLFETDSENNLGGSSDTMYFIGLDVHKKTISYCAKDAAGRVFQEGEIGSTHR